MTHLSVNINKVATLRNARGENIPDVVRFAVDCERFGAQGITVHPRPDERHITRRDVYDLRKVVTTEFNIEGYPTDDFMRMVIEVAPRSHTRTGRPRRPDLKRGMGRNRKFGVSLRNCNAPASGRNKKFYFCRCGFRTSKRSCKNRCGQGRVIHQTLCRQLHAKS